MTEEWVVKPGHPRLLDRVAAPIKRGISYRDLLGHGTPIAYIGWRGHSNVGDEAVFVAYEKAFPGFRFSSVPSSGLFSLFDWLRPGPLIAAAALGGGTLIGKPHQRFALERIRGSYPHLPFFNLGTGVEDPSFYGSSAGQIRKELRRWKGVLDGVQVTVRGPDSQSLLSDVGIHSKITGDPALLLGDRHPTTGFEEKSLGLNIGISARIWGQKPQVLLDRTVGFGKAMTRSGWQIHFIPMWPRDLPYMQEAARRIGSGVRVSPLHKSLDSLLSELRRSHVFVGQKLHSVVLATTVYVPAVMLDYHPKCLDFQRSLGLEELGLRVDRLRTDTLVELVRSLANDRDRHQLTIHERVSPLREATLQHAQVVIDMLRERRVR